LAAAGVCLPLCLAQNSIFTTIEASADHTILESALNQVPAVKDALADDQGEFTVVAPTDAAFTAALPELGSADTAALLARADLGHILRYHVLKTDGRLNPLESGEMTTLLGMPVTVNVQGDPASPTAVQVVGSTAAGVTISSSQEIQGAGGQEHVLHICTDRILLPNPIYEVAAADQATFSTLQAALDSGALSDVKAMLGLQNGGAVQTLFAPTNAAFDAYMESRGEEGTPMTTAELLAVPELATIVRYHVATGEVKPGEVSAGDRQTLYADGNVTVTTAQSSEVFVDGVALATSPSQAGNGVVNAIDKLLMPNVVEVAKSSRNTTALVEALGSAELVDTLTGPGPFTVFAPTNAAFEAYLAKMAMTFDELQADKEGLAQLLKHHVVPSEIMVADASASAVESLAGEDLSLGKDSGALLVDGVMVSAADMESGNGVVHTVGAVLELPLTLNIVELATAGGFTHLLSAVDESGLRPVLEATEPHTVFAPTDEAFESAVAALGEDDLAGVLARADLPEILEYHVVSGYLLAGSVVNNTFASVQGTNLTFDAAMMMGGAAVTRANLMATNGVMHVVNQVLLPPSLADVLAADEEFGSFLSAIAAANLTEMFGWTKKGGAMHTVFAPTNAAFQALIDGDDSIADMEALLAMPNLAEILKFHLVAGKVMAANLMAGEVDTLHPTAQLMVALPESGPTINGRALEETDILAGNGVIHKMDTVLMPVTRTIGEAAAQEGLTHFVAALEMAELLALLNGTDQYTVFAPSNAAFQAVVDALGEEDLASVLARADLREILKYHVISGQTPAEDLVAGEVQSEQGASIEVEAADGEKMVNGAEIFDADIQATNGLVHTLGQVMLPPSLMDVLSADEEFSFLVSALAAANLTEMFEWANTGGALYTVFAPTSAAFLAMVDADNEIADSDALLALPDLAEILTYHVVPGKVMAANLTAGSVDTLTPPAQLTVALPESGATINGNALAAQDIMAGNGVIHKIDAVLRPVTRTIVEKAAEEGLTHFVSALEAANLTDLLNGTDQYTVFAPNNSAFEAAVAALGEDVLAGLMDRPDFPEILKYHVVSGKMMADDLEAGDISTELGMSVEVTVADGEKMVDGAKILDADTNATNGVMHTIGEVMLPPSLLDVLSGVDRFATFVGALETAGLEEMFGWVNKGGAMHTVFAPTNAAFTALIEADDNIPDLVTLLDLPNLAEILQYHVVPGKMTAADLTAGELSTLTAAGNLTVALPETGATVDGAALQAADIMAGNGVIHEIGVVLMPPEEEVSEASGAAAWGVAVALAAVVVRRV